MYVIYIFLSTQSRIVLKRLDIRFLKRPVSKKSSIIKSLNRKLKVNKKLFCTYNFLAKKRSLIKVAQINK